MISIQNTNIAIFVFTDELFPEGRKLLLSLSEDISTTVTMAVTGAIGVAPVYSRCLLYTSSVYKRQVTTLVPTKNAIKQAKQLAKSQGDVKGPITHINGIPISMLDETGSVNIEGLLAGADISLATDNVSRLLPTSVKNDVGLALSETNEITSAKASDVFTNNRQTSPIPLSSAMSRKSSVNTTTNPHKKTSASILSGDPNSLFSMNNSLQANIQLNKTLSADSTTTVAPTTTANDNPNTGVNTLGRSPTNSYSCLLYTSRCV